jgi:hypothetical protein
MVQFLLEKFAEEHTKISRETPYLFVYMRKMDEKVGGKAASWARPKKCL